VANARPLVQRNLLLGAELLLQRFEQGFGNLGRAQQRIRPIARHQRLAFQAYPEKLTARLLEVHLWRALPLLSSKQANAIGVGVQVQPVFACVANQRDQRAAPNRLGDRKRRGARGGRLQRAERRRVAVPLVPDGALGVLGKDLFSGLGRIHNLEKFGAFDSTCVDTNRAL
jgi:hypothetical protein